MDKSALSPSVGSKEPIPNWGDMLIFICISAIWALIFPNLAAWDLNRKAKRHLWVDDVEDMQRMWFSSRDDEQTGTALLGLMEQQAMLQVRIYEHQRRDLGHELRSINQAASAIPVVGPAVNSMHAAVEKFRGQ